MTPEQLQLSLLKYLGVAHVVDLHRRKDGSYAREHHLYCHRSIIQDVLRWSVRQDGPDVIRVFEGQAPPF